VETMRLRIAVVVGSVFVSSVASMPVVRAQVVNRVCQVPGVFTSNGMICTRLGRKLVWKLQSPGPTLAPVPSGSPVTVGSTSAGQMPDPCAVVDTNQLAQVLGQEVKLSRPQESPQLRTCSIVSTNGFLAGSFAIRNDLEPFLIGGAFIAESRWLDPTDLDPKNAVQSQTPSGKTVHSLKTRQYKANMWWLSGNGYKYGVVVVAKLSTEEEQRIIAAIVK
jgi:hypothetical protein